MLRKNTVLASLFLLIAVGLLVSSAAAQSNTLQRDQIADKYKWDFSEIYSDWNAWEAGKVKMQTLMDNYVALKGTLAQGPDQLLKAYQIGDELDKVLYRVYRYPQLQRDVDTRDNQIAAKMQEVQIELAKFGTATAWFNPELLAIGWDTVQKWLDETPALAPYRYPISNLFRQQEHVLSADKEQLLSYFSQFDGTPGATYGELSTSDIKFPEVELSDGSKVTLTAGQYYNILSTNRNQADRAKAFESYYSVYNDNVNTYAAIYNGILQRDWAQAQARNYSSTLAAPLDGDNVPVDVYESLVRTVKAGTAPVKRYIELRRKALGLEKYHLYDGSIPIVEFNKEYNYDDIIPWVVASVKPLGKDYQEKMQSGFDSRWLDVYENEGKRAGAYSAGVYGVHPYMLLNYNGTIEDVFTVAHEMGHCMHTILSQENQPIVTSDPTIFVAEVASTMNEAFMMNYLVERAKSPAEKIVLLQHQIEAILNTFYTQVMFADFEWQAHRMVEAGQPITAEALRNLYFKLLSDYYGDAVTIDDYYGSTWTRIAHFYRSPYYVYKYATCFASSAKLFNEITSKDKSVSKDALDRYLTLLKSGGNDYPMEQLKKAGVDLSDPTTIQAVVDQMNTLVGKFEAELAKL